MSSHAQVLALRSHFDLQIEPRLAEVNVLDGKSFNDTDDAGYRYAMETLKKRKGVLLRGEPGATN